MTMIAETVLKLNKNEVKVFSNQNLTSDEVIDISHLVSGHHEDSLDQLPYSVLLNVLSFFTAHDLLVFSSTCQKYRLLVLNCWQLWRNLIARRGDLVLFQHQKFLKPQIHCNHCSAAAFQTSPSCPSQALIMPAETRKLLDSLESPGWLHAYINVYGLHKNWMTGRYHPILSRCHTKHVTGVAANQNCILSSGKDGYVYMYSRDFFVHYKLVKLDTEILCLEMIEESLICFVDSNGFLHLVDVPLKLPSKPDAPPATKLWTCPIADSDTKSLHVTKIQAVPEEIAEHYIGYNQIARFFSFLAVCLSHHHTVSVLRITLAKTLDSAHTSPEGSTSRWPTLDDVKNIDVVQRFSIAADDIEKVFIFSLKDFYSPSLLDSDKLLFVSSYDCALSVHHLMSTTCVASVKNASDVAYDAIFNPRSANLYSGGADGKVIVWAINVIQKDDATGTQTDLSARNCADNPVPNLSLNFWIERQMEHGPEVYSVQYYYHPHAQSEVHVVSGSSDSDIRIWHADTGHLIRILKGHVGIVRKLVVQRNQLLISTGDQKRIMIWDLSASRRMHLIKTGNYLQSLLDKRNTSDLTLFDCDNQNFPGSSSAILEPQVTDASMDDQVGAIRLHRNALCIDHLFVDNFSICIGSPEFPGSVGAILFW